MATNEDIMHAINHGLEVSQIKALAGRNGMTTLYQDDMHKVQIGVSLIVECISTVPPDLQDLDLLRVADDL